MTPLALHLCEVIEAGGPITVADYMNICLLHPEHGYYATRDPFGTTGDFTTAPEISQMFGELLGLAIAQAWLDRGSPAPFILAELGPGRGTLMADALRATGRVPGFHAALDLHLVEASPVLRQIQRDTIGQPLTHHDAIETLPREAPLYLIANEFFDALPIRQFQRSRNGWRERLVGLDGTGLAFGLSAEIHPDALAHRLDDTKESDVVEINASAQAIAAEIAGRIGRTDGVAILIDYGGWRSLGDTLQAVKAHKPVPPLASPGEADLTAHVDFEALARAAEGAAGTEMATQGDFLRRLGIGPRAEALAANLEGDALNQHLAAYQRLTGAQEMGTLFKAMALCRPDTPLPPGLVK